MSFNLEYLLSQNLHDYEGSKFQPFLGEDCIGGVISCNKSLSPPGHVHVCNKLVAVMSLPFVPKKSRSAECITFIINFCEDFG